MTAQPESFLPLPHLPFHILLALGDGAPSHGWAIIKRIEELVPGPTPPSSGSLYLAMGRLEERGLLARTASPPQETDERRRYYQITRLGRQVLEAEAERLAGLLEHVGARRPASGS